MTPMTRTQIYMGAEWAGRTEVNLTVTDALATFGIQGATIKEVTGVWEGDTERSVIVELIHNDNNERGSFIAALFALALSTNERTVLITDEPIQAEFRNTGN